jgi:hypothetical protein
MNRKSYNLILSIFAALAAFVVYILTLAPTVWFIDSGELASVASTLGIAHPTGYPLFTIIGHIFTLLPFSSSEVYKLNVMSAFFCSLGIFMFFYLMRFILSKRESSAAQNKLKKNPPAKSTAPAKPESLPEILKYASVLFSCLILAFSGTYWDTANSVEVYPIHCFFAVMLMLVFLKAIIDTKTPKETDAAASFAIVNKYYLLFAFLLGLSFTNHLTTILFAPACLTLFFVTNYKDKKKMYRLLGYMSVCFIIAFSLYIYLPLRANMNPTFMWGNPYNLERFYWHITGKQFSIWIFSAKGSIPVFIFLIGSAVTLSVIGLTKQKTLSAFYHIGVFIIIGVLGYIILANANEIVAGQFKKFTGSLGNEYGTGIVILGLMGIYRLSKYNITIYYFTLLTFFGCLFYSVNYDIHDIDSYFLLTYITIVIWIGFGAFMIAEMASEYLKTRGAQIAFGALLVLVTMIPLKGNWEQNDESKNYFVEENTMNIFKNVEPGGVVISSQWDFWVSASWYYKYVKHIRPDIIVIDKELLRRSWYFTFMERNYPDIYNNSRAEIERFLADLYKFEHNILYDTKTIMKEFADMITSIVVNNPAHKFYITWEIEQNKDEFFAPNYIRVPNGLLIQLVKPENMVNNSLPDYKTYDFQFTPTTNGDYYHKTLMNTYASMLTRSAGYLLANNRREEAKKYLDLALLAIPNFPQAIDLLKKNNLQ